MSDATLKVLYDAGPAQASFTRMRTGGYATFDGPYVCLNTPGVAHVTGVEFYPADSGIEVTDVGVTATNEPGPTPVTAKKRLRDLPQAAALAPDAEVTGTCDEAPTAVWIELRKSRNGNLGVVKTRYVYEIDGQEQRTGWFDKGYALTK